MAYKIEVNRMGRIVTGDDAGCWVKVEDDRENTGGYLIHQGMDSTFTRGSDSWVESREVLEGYFKESGWKIEWQQGEETPRQA